MFSAVNYPPVVVLLAAFCRANTAAAAAAVTGRILHLVCTAVMTIVLRGSGLLPFEPLHCGVCVPTLLP